MTLAQWQQTLSWTCCITAFPGTVSLSAWWPPPSPASLTPRIPSSVKNFLTLPPPRKVTIFSFEFPQRAVCPFSMITVNYYNELHAGRDVSFNSASSGILKMFCWTDKKKWIWQGAGSRCPGWTDASLCTTRSIIQCHPNLECDLLEHKDWFFFLYVDFPRPDTISCS